MKILWLATDRSSRVADIFGPLQRQVADLVDVDFIYRKLDRLPKAWQLHYTTGGAKPQRLVNVKKANEYDFIMVDAPFAFLDERWGKIKTPKGVLIEDQHRDVLRYSKIYANHKFDIFFTRYKNLVFRHNHLYNETIRWLPHSIDPDIFHDYKMEKKYGCLMIGRLNEKTYPLRAKVDKELTKTNIQYFKVDRPSEYDTPKKRWPVGQEYAKLINSSMITFSCMSNFQYPVLKFFEIPSCNSALFSDYNEELEELGFIPNKNMVRIDNAANIKRLIKNRLYHRDRITEISQNGHDMIHKNHTVTKRAEQFLNYLDKEIF